MGIFKGRTLLDHSVGKCDEALLTSELIYYTNDGRKITILPFWITDGASFGNRLLGCPFRGCYLTPSILHDILYRAQLLSRSESDDLLKEANEAEGVNFFMKYKMHIGLRIGGWVAWDNNKKNADKYRQYIRIEKANDEETH